ncbi:MAG TPA: trypsin-like peptidase domain-containing protein [Terriglobales bacterium]|jgi:S1-C subfamily serine protease
MRARVILLAVFFVALFFALTTHNGSLAKLMNGPSLYVDKHLPKAEITEAASNAPLDSEEQNNVDVYKRVMPSVVNITSTAVAFDFFYGAVPEQGLGTGFILNKEGQILTNNHVIRDARQIEVTLSNRKKYKAQIVGADPSHDLAVIQISAPNLTPVPLGDSRNLQVGQKVFAIGNPFGLSGTMTRGIISSIRQVREEDGTYIDEAIQTDAAINPGNSGGPLLNSRGEVIGINTMIATGGAGQSAGVGFAIPINAAKAVIGDLITFGKVRRPELGIAALPIGPELAQELGLATDSGVLIQRVTPGGAAERAGLHGGNERAYLGRTPVILGGDLIVAIDGDDVQDLQDLAHSMNKHRAGDTVKVTVYRGRRRMDVQVNLGEARGNTAA